MKLKCINFIDIWIDINNLIYRKKNYYIYVVFYLNKSEIIVFVIEFYYLLILFNKVYYKIKK